MKHFVSLSGVPVPVGPYSVAVEANGLIFLSGQVGVSPVTGKLVAGGIEAEAKQVLDNLKAALLAVGADFQQVTMVSIFVIDMANWSVVNSIYSSYVDAASPPARQTVAVKDLPLGALVEISAIAVR